MIRSVEGEMRPVPIPPFLNDRLGVPMRPGRLMHRTHWLLGDLRPGPDAVRMQSNDYLDLAADQRIAQAKADRLFESGHGDAISRVFAHDREDPHRAFERRVAQMMGAGDAVLAMSGYAANTGLIQALVRPDDCVFIDVRAHASLWEGVRIARARPIPFRHNDADDLAAKLGRFGPGFIIVDALYSTDGSLCPLPEITDLSEATGSVLIVDETHSFGTHGLAGAGLVEALGLTGRVHFRTAGLSKAMAARGGFIAGSARAIEFLRYEANPLIFSTAVLGYEIAGFETTLDIIADEPWRRQRLHTNHARLRDGLLRAGYAVDASDSQIVSIVTGTDEHTIAMRDGLARYGVFGSVFCPPATPIKGSLIRFTVNSGLSTDAIDQAIHACRSLIDVAGPSARGNVTVTRANDRLSLVA